MKQTNPKPRRPAKKSSFSDQEYINMEPNEEDIATIEGARYLPIDVVERDLDRWAWGTENFTWQFYRDSRGSQGISASIVLVIPWKGDDGKVIQRRLTGGCNFAITAYAPNGHFVATAKSECVKNAASDLGRKFGRRLNEGLGDEQGESPPTPAPHKSTTKMVPDKAMQEQYRKAVERGDETQVKILTGVYDFKTEENGAE